MSAIRDPENLPAGALPRDLDRRFGTVWLLILSILLASDPHRSDAAPSPLPQEDDAVLDEYFRRFDAVIDAEGHFQLATWCKERGLDQRVTIHLEAALRHDPDHRGAREALGFVLYEGEIAEFRSKRWLTADDRKEADRLEEELRRAREAEKQRRSKDPYLSAVDRILRRVAEDPYLSRIEFEHSEAYPPYLIFIERGRDFQIEEIGTVLTEFYKYFLGEFGTRYGLQEIRSPLVVLAFRDRKGYDDYCMHLEKRKPMQTRAAHYSPQTHEIVCHGMEQQPTDPYGSVIGAGIFTHEATHQLFHRYQMEKNEGKPPPPGGAHWFQEGLAEYCGTVRITLPSRETGKRRYLFGERSSSRASDFRSAREQGEPWFRLAELLAITDSMALEAAAKSKDPEKWEELMSLFYAEAWTFIKFLKEHDDGSRWNRFLAYMGQELDGKSGTKAAIDALGLGDLNATEEEWLEWFQKEY